MHPLGVWVQLLPTSGARAEGSLAFPPARLQRTENGGHSKARAPLRASPTGSTAHTHSQSRCPLRSQGHAQLRRGQLKLFPEPSNYYFSLQMVSEHDRFLHHLTNLKKESFHFQKILYLTYRT